MTAIMIDSREPDFIKAQFPDAAITLLDAGVAWVACDDGHILQIERKTTDDFLNSLRDGRLMEQVTKITSARHTQQLKGEKPTNWAYLMITGVFQVGANGNAFCNGRETGWNWNAIWGALLTVQEMGCFVTFAPSDTEYARVTLSLANRCRNEVIDILPSRMPIPMDAKTAFLCGLPGIGIERAKEIMQWAGGKPGHALVGLTDLEIKAPVGLAVRKGIRRFLGLAEQLTLELSIDDEDREKLILYDEKEKTYV